jgi:tryptophan synthase beta chain
VSTSDVCNDLQEGRMKVYDLPDKRGHFGPYGGVFVAETLMHALDELRAAYERYRTDPDFVAEF